MRADEREKGLDAVDDAAEIDADDPVPLLGRVVGDLAQTGASWGPASWADLFDHHAPNRWRRAELTVNYRTPAEIMEIATAVLASAAPGVVPPRSMRDEETAATILREALGLWRGPALADLAYEPFAQAEIRRLEELRQGALEERVDQVAAEAA